MAPFAILLGSMLGPIFLSSVQYFSEPFETLILHNLTILFKVLSIPKALILGSLFDHFFDSNLGPPLEEPFGSPLPPKVPTSPPHVDFGTISGPPGIQNRPLERPGAANKVQKGWSPERRSTSRGRPGNDLCSKGVPQAILIDFGTPVGD